MNEMKLCTGPCGQLLPATTEFFHRRKDGFHPQCKKCRCKTEKHYREGDPVKHEELLLKRRTLYRDDPEMRERNSLWNKNYRSRPEVNERIRIRDRSYKKRPDIHERISNQGRIYRQRIDVRDRNRRYANRPEVKAKRAIYENRPDVRNHIRFRSRNYYHRIGVRERILARQKFYNKIYHSRPEVRMRWRSHSHNYRARKQGVPGDYSVQQIQDQLKRQNYRCYYLRCGRAKFPKDKKYAYGYRFDIDHIVPLSRNEHNPRNDMSNIVLACKSCNTSKNNRLPHEWLDGGRLF